MPAIPFIGGAYEGRSKNMNAQRCVNLYPETDPAAGKNVASLIGTPGLKFFASCGTSAPVQGLHAWGDTLYAVSGTNLISVNSTGTVTTIASLGTSASSSSRINMEHNPFQLMLVDGTRGWIYTPTASSLQKITSAGFGGGTQVAFQDGFFIVTTPDTDEIHISAINNGLSWDPVDFVSAEGAPDPLVGVICNHRELWAIGEETSEVYYNSGDVNFPFDRIQGAFIETGCVAPSTIAKADNTVFWLGRDRRGNGLVYRANGYAPEIVSTRAIEYQISTYSDISDAFAYTYQQEGHTYYVLTFPTGNATWVYDCSTQLWHERSWFDPIESTMNRHRGNCYAFFAGKHIVGDFENGKLYELDLNTFTDDGNLIRRIRSCPHIHKDRLRVLFHKFELDMEFGVGLSEGQGNDPQAVLRWSDDGGHVWSNEVFASFGKLGEYTTRAVWRKLGFSRDRVLEVTITDPVKIVLINGHVDVTPCKN